MHKLVAAALLLLGPAAVTADTCDVVAFPLTPNEGRCVLRPFPVTNLDPGTTEVRNFIIFKDRDFVTVEGFYTFKGKDAITRVLRNGVLTGAARATVNGGDVAYEVNHPGGYCWSAGVPGDNFPNITPDIQAGDLVTITFHEPKTSADTMLDVDGGQSQLDNDGVPLVKCTTLDVHITKGSGPGGSATGFPASLGDSDDLSYLFESVDPSSGVVNVNGKNKFGSFPVPCNLHTNCFVIKGYANINGAGVGPRIIPTQLAGRIINPEMRDAIGRRDIRAESINIFELDPQRAMYHSALIVDELENTFYQVYIFVEGGDALASSSADVQPNMELVRDGGGWRIMSWELEDAAANRLCLTISEFGELGGPGLGGCPSGPGVSGLPEGTFVEDCTSVAAQGTSTCTVAITPSPSLLGAPIIEGYNIVAVEMQPSGEKRIVDGLQVPADPAVGTSTIQFPFSAMASFIGASGSSLCMEVRATGSDPSIIGSDPFAIQGRKFTLLTAGSPGTEVLVTPLGGSTAASAIQTSSVEIIAINAASIATSVTPISNRLRRLQQTTSVCDGLQTASSFPISIPILGLSLVEWCYDDLNTGLLHTGSGYYDVIATTAPQEVVVTPTGVDPAVPTPVVTPPPIVDPPVAAVPASDTITFTSGQYRIGRSRFRATGTCSEDGAAIKFFQNNVELPGTATQCTIGIFEGRAQGVTTFIVNDPITIVSDIGGRVDNVFLDIRQ